MFGRSSWPGGGAWPWPMRGCRSQARRAGVGARPPWPRRPPPREAATASLLACWGASERPGGLELAPSRGLEPPPFRAESPGAADGLWAPQKGPPWSPRWGAAALGGWGACPAAPRPSRPGCPPHRPRSPGSADSPSPAPAAVPPAAHATSSRPGPSLGTLPLAFLGAPLQLP